MYCGKCGTQNDDVANFCSKCGEEINRKNPRPTPRAVNYRTVGIIAVILIAVIILFSGIGLFGGRSAQETAEAVVENLQELDLIKMHELLPAPVQEALVANTASGSEAEYFQLLQEKNEEVRSQLYMFGNAVNWKFVKLQDCSKENLDKLTADYKETFGIAITDAKSAVVEISINLLGFTESKTDDFTLIKYKGGWYLDWDSLGL